MKIRLSILGRADAGRLETATARRESDMRGCVGESPGRRVNNSLISITLAVARN